MDLGGAGARAFAAEEDEIAGDGDLVEAPAVLVAGEDAAIGRDEVEGALMAGQAAEMNKDGALARAGRDSAEDGDQLGVVVDALGVAPADLALSVEDVEAVGGADGGGDFDEDDLAGAIAVEVLDDPAGAEADAGAGVGADIQRLVELRAPEFVALIVEGGDDAAVDEEAGDLGVAEETVMLGEVVGEEGEEDERDNPEERIAEPGVAPPGGASFPRGGPPEEFLGVSRDLAVLAGGAADGQARAAFPHLSGADAGIEVGGDLLPGVEGAAVGR